MKAHEDTPLSNPQAVENSTVFYKHGEMSIHKLTGHAKEENWYSHFIFPAMTQQ